MTENIVHKAARIATYAHRNQFRKGVNTFGVHAPYIEHPARVASMVLTYQDILCDGVFGDLDIMVAAAWLHDVVEDTTLDLVYISEIFDRDITDIIRGLTHNFAYYPDYVVPNNLNRNDRKRRELDFLKAQDKRVKVLKAFDCIDNLSTILSISNSFAVVYVSERKQILEAIKSEIPHGVRMEFSEILQKVVDKLRESTISNKERALLSEGFGG